MECLFCSLQLATPLFSAGLDLQSTKQYAEKLVFGNFSVLHISGGTDLQSIK